jgi:hypothetical protein
MTQLLLNPANQQRFAAVEPALTGVLGLFITAAGLKEEDPR